jgi:uncharacterized membrane protein YeiH
VVVVGDALHLNSTAATCAGAALCFGLRLAAIRNDWHLPVARAPEQAPADTEAAQREDKH